MKIATGLDIPRGFMGLAFSYDPGQLNKDHERHEQDGSGKQGEDMKRRNLLRHGTAVLFGASFLSDCGWLSGEPTPRFARIGGTDVLQLRAITTQLRALDRQFGGMGIVESVQALYRQGNYLMHAASNDYVRAQLAAALADLGNLAGWVANDVELGDTARAHMVRALDFAGYSNDPVVISATLRHLGRIEAHRGDPNYALKFLQLSEVGTLPPALKATIKADQAKLYAEMDLTRHANEALAACEGTEADVRGVTGEAHLLLGDLDTAQTELTAASQGRTETTARSRAIEACLLAIVHVRAGEARGLELAHEAIDAVEAIPGSLRTRDRLQPLSGALRDRGSTDARHLSQRIAELVTS